MKLTAEKRLELLAKIAKAMGLECLQMLQGGPNIKPSLYVEKKDGKKHTYRFAPDEYYRQNFDMCQFFGVCLWPCYSDDGTYVYHYSDVDRSEDPTGPFRHLTDEDAPLEEGDSSFFTSSEDQPPLLCACLTVGSVIDAEKEWQEAKREIAAQAE